MHNIAMLSAAHSHTQGYLRTINGRDDCRLTVIWDDMQERGERFVAEYGGEYSGDLDTTLARDDIDGFVICAENTRHLPLLKAAIPVGKPIFCEKPLSTDIGEAKEALGLIREHGTVVHMGYMQPFLPHMRGVMDYVNSGAVGKVTHARFRNAHSAAYGRRFDSPDRLWFGNPELAGGGAFMDMGTHAVHFLRTMLGPVEQVFSTVNNVSGIYSDVDDSGMALLRFENGCLATVEASWVHVGGPKGLEVTGSEGVLYDAGSNSFVRIDSSGDITPVPAGDERPSRVDRLVAVLEGNLSEKELNDDLVCAVDSVAIMASCYQSNEQGAWVDVPNIT